MPARRWPGFGYSLVFPALGVEAVRRVSLENRGTALGVYTVFADVSFFLVGPVAGAVIGAFGYASVFLFALVCVLAALGIVMVLRARRSTRTQSEGSGRVLPVHIPVTILQRFTACIRPCKRHVNRGSE